MIISHLFKPLSALTDEELMQRVGSKDDDRAYNTLYHRHARRLMGFFYRPLAADLTQDTFMRVWTARDRFSGVSFHTWLLTIAYNLLKNHYRHSEHEKDYESFAMQTQKQVGDNDIIDQLDQQAFDEALSRLEGTVKSRLHILTQTLKQKLKSS